MRLMLVASLVLSIAAPLAAQEARPTPATRARVIAALERLMATGEPRHTSHDAGQWLQAEVNAAFARGDREIMRLAQRAAIPLIAQVSMPVARHRAGVPLQIETPPVLTLPVPVAYRADLWASVDGGELVAIGTVSTGLKGSGPMRSLPKSSEDAGLHHIRVRARITYEDRTLPAETRDLPEIVYGLFDPDTEARFDVRFFIESAKHMSAQRLDPSLPDLAFALWLDAVTVPYSPRRQTDEEKWRISYCDEAFVEAGLPPRSRDLCTVAYFLLDGGWGEVWLRTGRIELAESEVRWLAETPAVELIRLREPDCREVSDGLSALPNLLAAGPSSWPSGDLSVAPEDITVTRTPTALRVTAIVRNAGTAHIRGAEVMIGIATSATDRGITRGFVVDVPRGSEREIQLSVPFTAPYGVIVVQAMQMSMHTPHDTWNPDPTADDTVAFRIISPQRAPKGFAASLIAQCGPICRGF